MEPSTSPHPPSRRQTCLVALGTVCVLVAPHLGVPVFLYPVVGLALCTAMLRYQGLDWAAVGFRWRALGPGPLLTGAILAAAYVAVNFHVIGPLLADLLHERPDLSDFAFVRAHLSGYLIALALAWVVGGFYEELVFRGFLQHALSRHLPASRLRPFIATVVTVLVFAVYHCQLGAFGMANALVFAVFAAAIRSRWPANLGYAIAFHACADMGAFTLMRLGYL